MSSNSALGFRYQIELHSQNGLKNKMQIYCIGFFFIQFPKYSWFKIYNAYKSRILKSNYE